MAAAKGGEGKKRPPLPTSLSINHRSRSCASQCSTVSTLTEGNPLLGQEPLIGSDANFGGSSFVEAERLWSISFPMVLSSISGYVMSLSSLVILGKYAGPEDLAGASLGTTFSNVCGCSMLVGFSEAIDTLCSQAYGQKNLKRIGRILQRGVVLLLVCATVSSLLCWFSEDLLIQLGQNPRLAKTAASYVRYQIPGLYGYAICMAMQRYLTAQEISRPLFVVAAGALPIHIAITYILVETFSLGQRGAAIAWSASFVGRAVVLVSYTSLLESRRSEAEKTWSGFDMVTAFQKWDTLLAVSLPAFAMLATEWWTFEILTLMSGLLPNPETQVIANTICSNVIGFMFMFHLGISIAVCVRVGAALGAYRTDCIKRTITSSFVICILQWAVVGGILITPYVRSHLSLLFAPPLKGHEKQSQDIRELVDLCLIYVVIQQFFDGIKEVCNGVIRGCGRQLVGMETSFVAYFVVCLPLGYALAFQKYQSWAPGVPGLFIAIIVASSLHAVLNGTVVLGTDWKKQTAKVNAETSRQHSFIVSPDAPVEHYSTFHSPESQPKSVTGMGTELSRTLSHHSHVSHGKGRAMTPTRGSPMLFTPIPNIPPPLLKLPSGGTTVHRFPL